ncbi:MAG: flagellar biosynthesis anti-sigma factor FlgM [Clostridiales bacterium]|nr:flagellar biosynthesis anti-sigma factor FlgM [Clostridiales bacterium]MCF8021767.1 flagellar biosynthesis anti-sigma factor FlgM [Clostridiales bacterium]
MKINPNISKAIDSYNNQARSNKGEKNPGTGGARQGDRLELSNEAKEIRAYLEKMKEQTGVREKLVESIKTKVDNGTYKPSSEKIAEGIINDFTLDEKV